MYKVFMRNCFLLVCYKILFVSSIYGAVDFDQIKKRQIGQYELADIMLDLAFDNQIELLDRWREIIPKSFKDLDFSEAYLLAAERSLFQYKTNQAISFYVRAYQVINSSPEDKLEAASQVAFYLYAQQKSSEALFYINRAIEQLRTLKWKHPKLNDVFYLKRRIAWRYFSRLDALPDNAISAVEFDGDDVWIGMWSGGVSRYSRSSSVLDVYTPRNSKISSGFVRDIFVEYDKVWVATHDGLSYYRKSDATWHAIPSMNNIKLKAIARFGGAYYLATLYRGVYRSYDGVTWTNIVPRLSVLDMLMVDGELYLTTPENGVYVVKDNKLSRFLPAISAKTIIADADPKFLWVGTYGQGLIKVRRSDAKVVETVDIEHLGSDYIESLLLVDQKLWVGTLEAGVSVFDIKKKQWQQLRLKEGLPGLDITTITRENNHIWFGTLAGGIGIYLFNEQYPIDEGVFRAK